MRLLDCVGLSDWPAFVVIASTAAGRGIHCCHVELFIVRPLHKLHPSIDELPPLNVVSSNCGLAELNVSCQFDHPRESFDQ